jgi:hypothetical protein
VSVAMSDDAADEKALDTVLCGFDGTVCSEEGGRLWRIGRWLRSSGAPRPSMLRVVGDTTVIVGKRILQIDEFGGVRDLSTTRRDLGTQLTSLSSWGRRR